VTRTVAVTGATGFIGSHVVEHLGQAGWRIRVLTRRVPKFGEVAVEAVIGSLDDTPALTQLVADADAIVHAAGLVRGRSVDEFFTANARGTANLVAAAIKAGRRPRFILLSSMAAREPQLSDYAASKRAGEAELARLGDALPWTAVRPPAVYGPGDRETLTFFQSLRWRVAPVPPAHDARLSLIHAGDLARAVVTLLEAPATIGEVYEVDDGHPDGYRWEEMVEVAARELGVSPLRIRTPRLLLAALAGLAVAGHRMAGSRPMLTQGKVREIMHPDWVCHDNRVTEITGWKAHLTLTEGFAQTIAWYRKNRWL